jgi:hypothetical protein
MKENKFTRSMRWYAGVLTDTSPPQLTADEIKDLHRDVAATLLTAADALDAWAATKKEVA